MTQSPPPASAAEPVTALLAARVQALRKARGISQTALAEQMKENHGLDWGRTTVAKLEAGGRKAVTVQELLALSLVFDLPPIMLLADPRETETLPLGKGLVIPSWEALRWLAGLEPLTESALHSYGPAASLIRGVRDLDDAIAELQRSDPLSAAEDPAQQRQHDDARHYRALSTITGSISMIRRTGAPLPPLPTELIVRRARELNALFMLPSDTFPDAAED